jgi:hypothetical protein
MIRPFDAWAIRKALVGHRLNGEMDALAEPFQGLAALMAGAPVKGRQLVLRGFLCGRPDWESIRAAIEDANPDGPEPGGEERERFATVADIRRGLSQAPWTWEGWIPSGGMFGLAGFEGTGKTRTAMDLHRRVWHGHDAPDGQRFSVAPGRPALWVCSDGHHDELARLVPAFGLPDESVVFPAPADEPYLGVDLDDPDLIGLDGMLERAILRTRPWCVFIDTLTSATAKNLCDQHVMKGLKAPLVRLAQTYGVSFGLLLHLSREGQVLGRRIKGLTRVLMHVDCPDPEHPQRLRFWVEKTYFTRPPALGLTLGADGNSYDFTPPRASARGPVGRPPESRDKARAFLVEALTARNDLKAAELCEKWTDAKGDEKAFWRARDAMVKAGELVCEGKPRLLHLVASEADEDADEDLF